MSRPAIEFRTGGRRDRGRATRGIVEALAVAALLGVGWQVAWRPKPPALAPTATTPGDPQRPMPGAVDPEKDRRVDEAIRRTRQASVTLEYEPAAPGLRHRVASGVVINEQGEILSVRIDPPADRRRPAIAVYDASGRSHRARWVAADPATGLTLLRAEGAGLRPIRLAAGDPSLGAEVFLVGTPFGFGQTVGRGHVADLGRRLPIGAHTLTGLIQVQASFHPGDSGALVADLDGGWLGLFRAAVAGPGLGLGAGNLGFVIPARDALWVADQLRATGKVDRAYLGLLFAPDEVDIRYTPLIAPNDLDAPPVVAEPGARVDEVVAGSPAEQAGLRVGDRIVRIDDRPVASTQDLTDRLDRTIAGAEVALEVVRESARRQLVVRAGSRPPVPEPSPRPAPAAGSAASAPAARPDDPAATIRALQDQLRESDRRLREMESRLERLERRAAPASAPTSAPKPSGV